MRIIIFIVGIILFTFSVEAKSNKNPKTDLKFSFAFFTDIHLNNGENNCFQGLDKAIESAKNNEIDFILTGGDNVDIDVLGKDSLAALELFQRFAGKIKDSGLKFHVTVGNHDRFWGCRKSDPLYNDGLFEKYIGESYYSFNHKGWHFIVLNTSNSIVDEQQKLWLVKDIEKTDAETPIIVTCHVPFLSVYSQAVNGKFSDNDTFQNFKMIWDMFEGKNLKLVLQGHQHLYEEIKTRGVQFITGGAVSGSWWNGSYYGTEEGYLLIEIDGEDFTWNYIDYGWEVQE
jgi:3',5'-cyclic AMP phosphodiesterase CpdA